MMLEPIRKLSVDVVPQAIVDLPVEQIVGKAAISEGYDDLDFFEGAAFRFDHQIEIAVRHYRGHPKGTTTIYIDSREADVARVTELVHRILLELHVPPTALRWQRRDNPDL
jgi:hypothetical protein